jgi:hypothetical protein
MGRRLVSYSHKNVAGGVLLLLLRILKEFGLGEPRTVGRETTASGGYWNRSPFELPVRNITRWRVRWLPVGGGSSAESQAILRSAPKGINLARRLFFLLGEFAVAV